MVVGPSGRSVTGGGPSGSSGTSRETIKEVQDGSGDPRKSLERVQDSRGGPGRVERHSGKSGTSRGTLGKVWDGSEDPRRGPGRVGRPSERLGQVGDLP